METNFLFVPVPRVTGTLLEWGHGYLMIIPRLGNSACPSSGARGAGLSARPPKARRSATPSTLRQATPPLCLPPYHSTHRFGRGAYFFGGAFLANALPHLGNGISGHAFQSPFASPPGEGLSSSTVNVLWGLLNLAIGYLLVCRVGKFDLRNTKHVVVLGAGIVFISLVAARGFGRFHGGL